MEIIHKVNKVLINALLTLLVTVVIAFIILLMIGFEPFVVQSGSMQPAIQTGSISFINKHVKYKDIKENDIIAYTTSNGSRITHRAIRITDKGIETKGDNNDRTRSEEHTSELQTKE